MKTAQIMERDLNGVIVRQNHKTGFFNANDLLDLYNSQSQNKKRIENYLRIDSFKELQEAVIKNEISNTSDVSDLEIKTIETKRGNNGGTWMHPYIFIDFAMWLSADFKVTCLKWLYDNLIKFRDDCGESFKAVNDALFENKPNLSPFEYANEAKMINKLVFGRPDKDQRNNATEDELEMLKSLQKADVEYIKRGLDYYDRFESLKKIKEILLITK